MLDNPLESNFNILLDRDEILFRCDSSAVVSSMLRYCPVYLLM
jgi:hypothetical protein